MPGDRCGKMHANRLPRPPCRLLAPLLLLVAAAPAPSSWSNAAVGDLKAINELIQDNHPGPVDALNPGFHAWMDQGAASLLPMARTARSLHDYQLVIRDYVNGFADGHLEVSFTDTEPHLWPGFLTREDMPGEPVLVSVVEQASGSTARPAPGDELVSCDRLPVQRMMQDNVLRPLLNPHVPQRLRMVSSMLLVADTDDPRDQPTRCIMRRDRALRTLALNWRQISEAALMHERTLSSGIEIPEIGLRQVGDVAIISLPTFNPVGPELARMQALVASVQAQAVALHAVRHVVLDVRGNTGGSDGWGRDVAAALWGRSAVDAITASISDTVDWRVSARNLAALRSDTQMLQREGQPEIADYTAKLSARMSTSLSAHQLFMREIGLATGAPPHLVTPFAHPVYLLTTPHCASACLDFADLLGRLPGITRIGLETSADTDYLEEGSAKLPSGQATLSYAMKVYRQRARGANVSDRPAIGWPGGIMTDRSIASWVDTLP